MNAIAGMAQSSANVSRAWAAAAERPDGAGTVTEIGPSELTGHAEPRMDQYVHGEEPVSAGLYHLTRDENGTPKIIFDAPGPKAAEGMNGGDNSVKSLEQPLEEKEALGEDDKDQDKEDDGITIMETTGNCDEVEAEIRKLMQEKAKLSQQMNRCADNPDKQQEMQTRLQQLENELRVKDTDEYRKQHMVITSQRIVKRPNE